MTITADPPRPDIVEVARDLDIDQKHIVEALRATNVPADAILDALFEAED
jgi:hypothetical protein